MKKKYIIISIIFVLTLALDMVTKVVFEGVDAVFIPGIINIHFITNPGAAFGIFGGKLWFLILITFVMITAIILFDIKAKRSHALYAVAIGLILSGALGNLIDRLMLGEVRDFIQFAFWPQFAIFNIADICLTVGAVLMAIYILFIDGKKVSK